MSSGWPNLKVRGGFAFPKGRQRRERERKGGREEGSVCAVSVWMRDGKAPLLLTVLREGFI